MGGGAPLFERQAIFTLPDAVTLPDAGLVQQENGRGSFGVCPVLRGLPIVGTGNAASMQLRRLGEACLLSMAPFSRPHTQQHSEAHSV